jgi:hypothetical protein
MPKLEEGTLVKFRHLGYDSQGVPKSPIYYRNCLDKTWNDLLKEEIKYYFYTAPNNHNQPRCQGCRKVMTRQEDRIMVNACYITTRANYTVSFCVKRECFDLAFNQKKPTTEYPIFTGKIFVNSELANRVNSKEDFQWVIGEK